MPSESVRQVDARERTPSPSGSVPKRLGDQLSSRIADLIDQGEFPEGRRLPAESGLAERFEVSRPVVREALSRLRSMGVIESRKGSGSYVRKRQEAPAVERAAFAFGPATSLAEVRKCFEFRAAFESEAAYHAALNRAPEDIARMREALARIDSAIATGGVGANSDCDFHLAIARASDNEFFENTMRLMREPMEFAVDLARRLAMTRPGEHRRIVQGEHVAIFEAIERREAEAARVAMRAHLENTCARIFEGHVHPAE